MMAKRAALGLVAAAFLPTLAWAEPVTLINIYEVPPGEEKAAIRYWERARDFMARQPGYRGTRLHQALSPDARFLPRRARMSAASLYFGGSVFT